MASLSAFWAIVFILLGSAWYVVDRSIGRGLYRAIYNLTHDKAESLPPGAPNAFIYGQPTRRRFYIAIILSTIQAILIAHMSEQDRLIDLLIWFLGIPALLIGFFLGPQIYRLWSKKEEVFTAIDRVESGESQIAPQLTSAVAGKWEQLKDSLASPKEKEPAEPEPRHAEIPESEIKAEVKSETKPEPETDGRAAIDRFTKKK